MNKKQAEEHECKVAEFMETVEAVQGRQYRVTLDIVVHAAILFDVASMFYDTCRRLPQTSTDPELLENVRECNVESFKGTLATAGELCPPDKLQDMRRDIAAVLHLIAPDRFRVFIG